MNQLPIVLNFSGNDSAGYAGLAADIKAQHALGVHSTSVITANTAQNNQTVAAINPVDDAVFETQLAALNPVGCDVVKVGLVGSVNQINAISHFVKKKNLSLVLDTVFGSSSGSTFGDEQFVSEFKKLIAVATVVTPNIPEAERLVGEKIQSTSHIVAAAQAILKLGAKSVFIKGGHAEGLGEETVQDYFTNGETQFWLASPKMNTSYKRGTGCALASAIAAALAKKYSVLDAVVIGKMAINQGLRQGYEVEKDAGPINIDHFPDDEIDLPFLSAKPIHEIPNIPFKECNQPKLGLYPVVDRSSWIKKLAGTGVTTIQLRVKDLDGDELKQEISTAIENAKSAGMRLFINDYWELAIECGAYGVHLGQEDLDTADIAAIKQAGLRLGTSTHCHYEVARAHYLRPSYIACGPVYHTNTKQMPWIPHGLDGLQYWRKVLSYPLVAIGGINSERIQAVAATGVDSVAMITAITLADSPETVAKKFVKICSGKPE